MDDLSQRITYHEIATFNVAKILKEKGYQLADSDGVRVKEPNRDYIGILEPKRFLGLELSGIIMPASYIGTLLLNGQGATFDGKWILDVYGRNNVPKMTELMKELAQSHNVQVAITLASEKSKARTFL
ncbi:MAG: hypothetical protein HYW24_00935 [Candidatus Aenigmarchaeota archaeon]|nr:hypothetical protein [Candidatus Aenigmarchaeota archaeon]